MHATPVSDFAWYFARGTDIAHGRGYQDGGVSTAYWPVGYPAFLGAIFAVFGSSITAAVVANVLLSVGFLVLFYDISLRLTRSRFASSILMVLLVFYPPHTLYTTLLASEWLSLFLLAFALSLWLRRKRLLWAAASGATFSLASYVKPQVAIVPIVLFLVFGIHRNGRRREVRALGIIMAGMLLVQIPWAIRNYVIFRHVVFISTNGGVNLLIGNNPTANGTYVYPEWISKRLAAIEGGEYAVDQEARRLAVAFIRTSPRADLVLAGKKLWATFAGKESDTEGVRWNVGLAQGHADVLRAVSSWYYTMLWIVVILSVAVLCWRRAWRHHEYFFLPLAVAGALTVSVVVFFGMSRFHFPIMPWLVVYPALAVSTSLITAP